MTPLNSSRQYIYTRQTAERHVSRRSESKMIAALMTSSFECGTSKTSCWFILQDNQDSGWTRTPQQHLLVGILTSVPSHLCDKEGSRGVPCWANINGAEQTLLKFLPWLAETGWRMRDEQTGRQVWITRPGKDLIPISKLCGLPAHLPRNLASFRPSVDDSNSGGAGSRWLGHYWWFLSYRGGGVRVLIVNFHSRG